MSPINVHVTRYPMGGNIIFSKYHAGAYLVAWHPKSSTKNERTTIVLENNNFGKILYRQIAGALARRIVNYAEVGDLAEQGKDAGFIKFGSRVDLFVPIGTKVNVKLNAELSVEPCRYTSPHLRSSASRFEDADDLKGFAFGEYLPELVVDLLI